MIFYTAMAGRHRVIRCRYVPRATFMMRYAPKFSIRTILVVMALIAMCLGWFVPRWQSDIRDKRVLNQFSQIGTVTNWSGYDIGPRSRFTLTLTPTVTTPGDDDLSAFAELNELKLEGASVTDRWLHNFKVDHVKHLRFLDLSGTTITDAGWGNLPQLPNLKWLNLNSTLVTSAGLVSLERMPNLERLSLDDTAVDDTGVAAIVETLPHLRALSLNGSRLTDDGLIRLSKIRYLGAVGVHNTAVTAEGARRLVSDSNEKGVNILVHHGSWPPN